MPRKRQCVKCDTICFSRSESPLCKKCSCENRRIHTEKGQAQRKSDLKLKYNLTIEDFDTMWIVFKGKCGICFNDLRLPLKQRGQPPDVVVIDHNHKTGKIRGLLCNACNKALGLFRDDPKRLAEAIKWCTNGKTGDENE